MNLLLVSLRLRGDFKWEFEHTLLFLRSTIPTLSTIWNEYWEHSISFTYVTYILPHTNNLVLHNHQIIIIITITITFTSHSKSFWETPIFYGEKFEVIQRLHGLEFSESMFCPNYWFFLLPSVSSKLIHVHTL